MAFRRRKGGAAAGRLLRASPGKVRSAFAVAICKVRRRRGWAFLPPAEGKWASFVRFCHDAGRKNRIFRGKQPLQQSSGRGATLTEDDQTHAPNAWVACSLGAVLHCSISL